MCLEWHELLVIVLSCAPGTCAWAVCSRRGGTTCPAFRTRHNCGGAVDFGRPYLHTNAKWLSPLACLNWATSLLVDTKQQLYQSSICMRASIANIRTIEIALGGWVMITAVTLELAKLTHSAPATNLVNQTTQLDVRAS